MSARAARGAIRLAGRVAAPLALALAAPGPGGLRAQSLAPGPPLVGDTTAAWGADSANPCVPDVTGALEALRRRGELLGFHLGGVPRLGSLTRHWQGIQRLAGDRSRYLVLSRSGRELGFVIVRLASRDSTGLPLRSNRAGPRPFAALNVPPDSDRIVAGVPPEPGFTHAGGLALIGRVLAVPYDHGPGSRVVFYDVAVPERPRRLYALDHSSVRYPSDPRQASAVGITRLADGRWLLVLGVHSSKVLDFYVSLGTRLADSASIGWRRFYMHEGGLVGGFQNLALVTQCDGRIFLIGTHNTAIPPPSLGDDRVRWYELSIDGRGRVQFRGAGRRTMFCVTCNFGAGGGLFVDRDRRIVVYGIERGASGPLASVSVEEFAPSRSAATAIGGAWAELFEDRTFEGRVAVLDYGRRAGGSDTVVAGIPEGLGAEVSSARWSVPPGWRLRLFDDSTHGCSGEFVDLVGTGETADLRRLDFDDRARCAVWVRAGAGQ